MPWRIRLAVKLGCVRSLFFLAAYPDVVDLHLEMTHFNHLGTSFRSFASFL